MCLVATGVGRSTPASCVVESAPGPVPSVVQRGGNFQHCPFGGFVPFRDVLPRA